MKNRARHAQSGMFLLEALIAILIFAFGVLGMVALSGKAVSATAESQYRADASNFANAIASEIALAVDRTTDLTVTNSLAQFNHQTTVLDPVNAYCSFSGDETINTTTAVKALLHKAGNSPDATAGLPGADTTNQQIVVRTDGAFYNRVSITLCWKAPADSGWHRYTLVTYVNGARG